MKKSYKANGTHNRNKALVSKDGSQIVYCINRYDRVKEAKKYAPTYKLYAKVTQDNRPKTLKKQELRIHSDRQIVLLIKLSCFSLYFYICTTL